MLQEWLPYIVIALVAAVLIAATIVLARLAWRKQVRRYIVGLMGRREALGAALKTVDASVAALSAGTVQDVLAFAEEDSEERRAFVEIGARMRIQEQELEALPLPKSLWELADTLQEAAKVLAAQATGVGEAVGDQALDSVVALDVTSVRASLDAADGLIAALSTEYDLTDPAVYGGGLYI